MKHLKCIKFRNQGTITTKSEYKIMASLKEIIPVMGETNALI